jgi:rhodanese-related sulfurtransferase
MKAIVKMILIIALGASIGCVSATTATSRDVSMITKQELRSMLDDPDVIILDVRPEQQWKASELEVRGAVYENPNKVKSWAGKYPKDKTLILY